jgi:flagellar basal body P-ring protein FlgI
MKKKAAILKLEKETTKELSDLNDKHMVQILQLQEQKQQALTSENNNLNTSPIRTVEAKRTTTSFVEEIGKFTIIDSGISLEEMVNALNSLGVTPKEMGSILRAIKAAGALQADIKET